MKNTFCCAPHSGLSNTMKNLKTYILIGIAA